MTDTPRPSVAVVGGGVAGLTAAHLLSRSHHVTLFEADDRLGGHAHTHQVALEDGSTAAVDSGFIVLNDRTYPLLRRLFADLGVATRPTEMSMSISCDGCGLNYVGGRKAPGIFAQRRRVLDPRFWRMLLAVRRFQKAALALLDEAAVDPGTRPLTYGQFLDQHGFGDYFVRHYALPVVACVWSMGHREALAYPAAYLFAFLKHHGFLALGDAPTWHTVVGGSRTYVDKVAAELDDVRLASAVRSITRQPRRVEIEDAHGRRAHFDKVVVAAHADDALAMLADASVEEKEVLGAFGYSSNQAVLHRDESVLPVRRVGRASWNYRLDACEEVTDRARVSYWMNRLQGHAESDPLVVTLNPGAAEDPADVVAAMTYRHPTYTAESVAAQARLASLNNDRVAFAGSYHGWGFHEDGCRSGVEAAEALGATW